MKYNYKEDPITTALNNACGINPLEKVGEPNTLMTKEAWITKMKEAGYSKEEIRKNLEKKPVIER